MQKELKISTLHKSWSLQWQHFRAQDIFPDYICETKTLTSKISTFLGIQISLKCLSFVFTNQTLSCRHWLHSSPPALTYSLADTWPQIKNRFSENQNYTLKQSTNKQFFFKKRAINPLSCLSGFHTDEFQQKKPDNLGSPNVTTQTESDDNSGDNAPVLVEKIWWEL